MSKCIVFGASGFAGQALLPLLNTSSIEHLALSSKQLDLTAEQAPEQIAEIVKDGDTVLMLSAYTPEKGKPDELTIRNIVMIKHLISGLAQRAISHFIYISSDAVYPLTADVVDEHTTPHPYSLYGYMHALREQFVREAFPAEKLTILRPCAIYGTGDTHNAYGINRFIRAAQEQGEITLFGEGEEYRDHLHVEDFARILLTASERHISGTFNVASGTSWRFGQIAKYIQERIGTSVKITCKPRAMPIYHRHVNLAHLHTYFPDNSLRKINIGIDQLLAP